MLRKQNLVLHKCLVVMNVYLDMIYPFNFFIFKKLDKSSLKLNLMAWDAIPTVSYKFLQWFFWDILSNLFSGT